MKTSNQSFDGPNIFNPLLERPRYRQIKIQMISSQMNKERMLRFLDSKQKL